MRAAARGGSLTTRMILFASDDDAEDFEGNDTYVHFISRPCDVAAEKADEIL